VDHLHRLRNVRHVVNRGEVLATIAGLQWEIGPQAVRHLRPQDSGLV